MIRFLHPVHNFAVLQYDVAAVGDTPIKSARLGTLPAPVGPALHHAPALPPPVATV